MSSDIQTTQSIEARSAKRGMVTPERGVITNVIEVTYLGAPAYRVHFSKANSQMFLPWEELDITDDPRALDVWLRFGPNDQTDEPDAEANVYPSPSGYEVAWYLTAVGLVTRVWFATYDEARAFLASEGFDDFSTGEELSE